MKDFLFAPEQARTPLGVLSGGERGRLMLARALAKPSNLLVLDEPTNDLDLETLDLLEEMLADYAGTVILISHDRDFLDRVVNAVLVPEGDGRWTEYAGGYSDMLAQRGAELPAQAAQAGGTRSTSGAPKTAPRGRSRQAALSFHEKHALETLPTTIARCRPRSHAADVRRPGSLRARPQAFDETSAALPPRRPSSPRPRRTGWSSSSCARTSPAGDSAETAFTLFPERVSVCLADVFCAASSRA